MAIEIAGAGAVVTGAGAGIGRALARGLAAAGARVVVNDLNFEAATAVAKEIGGYPAPGDAATEPGVTARRRPGRAGGGLAAVLGGQPDGPRAGVA